MFPPPPATELLRREVLKIAREGHAHAMHESSKAFIAGDQGLAASWLREARVWEARIISALGSLKA